LVDKRLSKASILETTDKLKRARDHANNASLLGLLVPIPVKKRKEFSYCPSIFGQMLYKYKFEDECPKDLHESAIFTDRILRLKLTNAYDSRHTYERFHNRPFLNILTILSFQKLHLSQIHYLTSLKEDFSINTESTKNILKEFSKYPVYESNCIRDFMKDFKINTKNKRAEVQRSTRPLMDWAQQVGLVEMLDKEWYLITEKGHHVKQFYSSLFPIWFDQLPFDVTLSSALLLLYQNGYLQGKRINSGDFSEDALEILKQMQAKFSLWNRNFEKLKQPIDFCLDYDVPVQFRDTVRKRANKMTSGAINSNKISLWPISEIERILSSTGLEKKQFELGKALGIDIPRRECFQTDLEWQVCIKLRLLQLPAVPYQGELEGATDLPMATDNPDVMIRNDLKSLVECKSANEWGETIKLGKKVGGELNMYQLYAEDVKANSAIFVCDVKAFDEKGFKCVFEKMGDRLTKIVMTTWDFLNKSQKNDDLRKKFIATIKEPESIEASERIFV
jgi:hypothetical protein